MLFPAVLTLIDTAQAIFKTNLCGFQVVFNAPPSPPPLWVVLYVLVNL